MSTPRRLTTARRAALIAASLVAAAQISCASTPPSPPVVTVSSDSPHQGIAPPTPGERLVALLTEDSASLERVAMSLASIGDPLARRAAGRRLVELARGVGSEAWRARETARSYEDEDEGGRGQAVTIAHLEAREAMALASILAAMSHIGGPAIVEYCFALGADDGAPLDRRHRALRVLDHVLDPGDTERRARRRELLARLPAPLPSHGAAESAAIAVAHMRRALRACYTRALQQDPALRAKARVSLHVGPTGRAKATFTGDPLPADLQRCIADAAERQRFVDPASIDADITISFVLQPE